MTDQNDMQNSESVDVAITEERRSFLRGLGKWSQAVIGGVLLGSALTTSKTAEARGAWANRRGGGGAWANRHYGGGAWANRGYGGGAWANRPYGGGAWANRRGYGGSAWANRRW